MRCNLKWFCNIFLIRFRVFAILIHLSWIWKTFTEKHLQQTLKTKVLKNEVLKKFVFENWFLYRNFYIHWYLHSFYKDVLHPKNEISIPFSSYIPKTSSQVYLLFPKIIRRNVCNFMQYTRLFIAFSPSTHIAWQLLILRMHDCSILV